MTLPGGSHPRMLVRGAARSLDVDEFANLVAIAFLVENLAADLETAQLEVATKEVEKIRRLLSGVFDEMHLLFAPPPAKSSESSAPTAPGPVGAEP
jgi:hypothetical protein